MAFCNPKTKMNNVVMPYKNKFEFHNLTYYLTDLSPVSPNSGLRIWHKLLENLTEWMPDSCDVTSYCHPIGRIVFRICVMRPEFGITGDPGLCSNVKKGVVKWDTESWMSHKTCHMILVLHFHMVTLVDLNLTVRSCLSKKSVWKNWFLSVSM